MNVGGVNLNMDSFRESIYALIASLRATRRWESLAAMHAMIRAEQVEAFSISLNSGLEHLLQGNTYKDTVDIQEMSW